MCNYMFLVCFISPCDECRHQKLTTQRQQADADRATRLATAQSFAPAAHQLLPRRRRIVEPLPFVSGKLLGTSASLLGASALLLVTRSY